MSASATTIAGPDERMGGVSRRLPVRALQNGDLVRMVAKGDDQAWQEIVSRFGGLVHRVAKRVGLDDRDAADVAQATWLKLMLHVDCIREPERIAGWLATTARRESLQFAIGGSRLVVTGEPIEPSSSVAPRDDVAEAALRLFDDGPTERAIRTLPDAYQRLLHLLFSDAGLTYAEISEAMAIPIGSIGPMRLRALQQLRRRLSVTVPSQSPSAE